AIRRTMPARPMPPWAPTNPTSRHPGRYRIRLLGVDRLGIRRPAHAGQPTLPIEMRIEMLEPAIVGAILPAQDALSAPREIGGAAGPAEAAPHIIDAVTRLQSCEGGIDQHIAHPPVTIIRADLDHPGLGTGRTERILEHPGARIALVDRMRLAQQRPDGRRVRFAGPQRAAGESREGPQAQAGKPRRDPATDPAHCLPLLTPHGSLPPSRPVHLATSGFARIRGTNHGQTCTNPTSPSSC